jgi:hypothetical protein
MFIPLSPLVCHPCGDTQNPGRATHERRRAAVLHRLEAGQASKRAPLGSSVPASTTAGRRRTLLGPTIRSRLRIDERGRVDA